MYAGFYFNRWFRFCFYAGGFSLAHVTEQNIPFADNVNGPGIIVRNPMFMTTHKIKLVGNWLDLENGAAYLPEQSQKY